MQIADLYKNAVCRLQAAGIADSEMEAALLLCHLLDLNRSQFLIAGDRPVSAPHINSFEKYLLRRLQREPLAYILGEWEFWSLPFKVNSAVLIPRPETEFLIETVLRVLKDNGHELQGPVLDLGTGSGVIAVILAIENPGPVFFGVDFSLDALQVARENARRHGVDRRVHFINADWFSCIKTAAAFDLVVSNPPYVPAEMFASGKTAGAGSLQPEVGLYEPRLALNGGRDGLEAISRIAMDLSRIIKPGGWFFMEIGEQQAPDVLRCFRELADYDSLHVHKDYAGRPRVFQGRKKNRN